MIFPKIEGFAPAAARCAERLTQESSWQVEYIPGHVSSGSTHLQFKYACRQCEQNAENPNIELAQKPSQPIDKGMAGSGIACVYR